MKLTSTETPIGVLLAGTVPESIVVSSDNRHFAAVHTTPEGPMRVLHDNREGPWFEGIRYGSPIFSPDGQRLAYAGVRGERAFILLDGEEIGNTLSRGDDHPGLFFSPDSRHFAFIHVEGENFRLVIDGIPGKPYTREVAFGPSLFSPNGSRTAYGTVINNKPWVVVDGEEIGPFDEVYADSITFSADNSKVAWIAGEGGRFDAASLRAGIAHVPGGKVFMVVNGERGPAYNTLSRLLFSPDGQRLAYIAGRDGARVVIDGEESEPYEGIGTGTPVFSPDSKRIAWVAQRGSKSSLVVDGQEHVTPYRYIQKNTLVFSPDSRRIGYEVRTGLLNMKGAVVIDGVAGKDYTGLGLAPPVFSPDSRRVAHFAMLGLRKKYVVVDGQESQPCDGMADGTIVFSPDSSCVAWPAKVGNAPVIGITGLPGDSGAWIATAGGSQLRGSTLTWDGPRTVHTLGFRPDGRVFVFSMSAES